MEQNNMEQNNILTRKLRLFESELRAFDTMHLQRLCEYLKQESKFGSPNYAAYMSYLCTNVDRTALRFVPAQTLDVASVYPDKVATVHDLICTLEKIITLRELKLRTTDHEDGTFTLDLDFSEREIKRILHVTAGSDSWEPTAEELEHIAEIFATSHEDPMGVIITTRPDIDAKCISVKELEDFNELEVKSFEIEPKSFEIEPKQFNDAELALIVENLGLLSVYELVMLRNTIASRFDACMQANVGSDYTFNLNISNAEFTCVGHSGLLGLLELVDEKLEEFEPEVSGHMDAGVVTYNISTTGE